MRVERAVLKSRLTPPAKLVLLSLLLTSGPLSLADLAEATDLHLATVKRVLAHLRGLGVVRRDGDGTALDLGRLPEGGGVSSYQAQRAPSNRRSLRLARVAQPAPGSKKTHADQTAENALVEGSEGSTWIENYQAQAAPSAGGPLRSPQEGVLPLASPSPPEPPPLNPPLRERAHAHAPVRTHAHASAPAREAPVAGWETPEAAPASSEAAAVLSALRTQPALSQIATRAVAEHQAGQLLAGRYTLADVLLAVADLGSHAGSAAATGSPWGAEYAARRLVTYALEARRRREAPPRLGQPGRFFPQPAPANAEPASMRFKPLDLSTLPKLDSSWDVALGLAPGEGFADDELYSDDDFYGNTKKRRTG